MRKISNSDYDSLLRYVPQIVGALDKELLKQDNGLYNAVRLTNRIIKKMRRNENRTD